MNFDLLRLFHILRPVTGDILRYNGNAFVNESLPAVLTATATWDIPSTNAARSNSTTITVTGVQATDTVICNHSAIAAASNPALVMTGQYDAADTVRCTLSNVTAAAVDVGSGTLRATVLQFA